MRSARIAGLLLTILVAAAVGSHYLRSASTAADPVGPEGRAPDEMRFGASAMQTANPATHRYRLDSGQSRFIAHALAGGLFWFKGHDHLVAVREFTGEAQLTPGAITPASLQITAKAASMVETSSVFTDPQKAIINGELRDIVLEPAKYPDILFHSTEVTGKTNAAGEYEVKIKGFLNLHGVTRQITIPATVTTTGSDLRAKGEFSIDRSQFGVKATSAFHGLVRVRNTVKFEFDIVGHLE